MSSRNTIARNTGARNTGATPDAVESARLEGLTRVIRRAFQDFRAIADDMHAATGVTTAMRSVLEHLFEHGAAAVPQIAEAKNVTRQHIQQIVDQLLEKGYAELHENPRHRRSKLVDLTPKARTLFDAMRDRERSFFREVAVPFTAAEIAATTAVIEKLRRRLKELSENDS